MSKIFKTGTHKVKTRLKSEVVKSGQLDWRFTLLVIMGFIGAIIFGIIIGYLASVLGLMQRI